MATHHLTHAEFFTRLIDLLNSQQGVDPSSIYLTQKRLSYPEPPASAISSTSTGAYDFADLHPPSPLPILIRATNGKNKKHRDAKVKLSTVVAPDELQAFFTKYAECCRAGMGMLRKRDRKARKKDKKKKGKVGAGAIEGEKR